MQNEEFYAYPEEYRSLEAVMRFHAVKRWHMIDTTRTQTLAEHSANVAALAFYIAASSPQMFFGDPNFVARLALFHDMPEVFSGDIPSHTKPHLSGIDELERSVTPHVFTEPAPVSPHVSLMIKLCDIADGVRFIRSHGVDITSDHAKHGLEQKWSVLKNSAIQNWPDIVASRVNKLTTFYAYEMS